MPTTITRTSLLAVIAVAVAIAVIFAAGARLALADQDQAPTGLTLTATDANTVQATWTAHPDGARDYRLSWAPHDENFKTWTDTDWNAFPTGNSYTITGLEGGSTYKVKVRARFETGPPSDWSGIVTATTTAPPEPTPAPTPQPTPEPTPEATPEPAIDYDQERSASVSLGDITNAAVDNRDETVDTDDYFHFSLTHRRTVGLRVRRLDYNADLYVEDNDGAVIASSENGGDQKEVLNLTLAATGANEYYYVRVEAKEDGSNDYQLRYFTETPPNAAATGAPTISGAAQVRETLTAGVFGIADDNGLGNASFDYQWVRSVDGTDTDITGATGSTFLLTYDELDHTIRVRVSFTDDAGYPETLTGDATATVVRPSNASPSGRPAVSGVLAVGKTLTADTSGITDPNGLSNPAFTYQWVRSIDSTDTHITGATGSTYTLTSGDGGAALKVTVAFTDDDGYAETLTSDPTEVLETEGQDGQDGQGNGVQTRVAPTDSPQNLQASAVAYATVVLAWDEPDTGITHIRIVRTGGNLPDKTTTEALSSPRDSRTFARLEPDTSYTLTVELGTSDSLFGPASSVTVRTLPIPAPTNVRVTLQVTTAGGGTQVTFKWDNPATSGRLTSSHATYDANMQTEANRGDSSQLIDSRRLTFEPETTHSFATWYRTEDETGAFHEGPKAYVEFTAARLPEVGISGASVEEGGTLTFTLTITDFADGRAQDVTVSPYLHYDESELADYSSEPPVRTIRFTPGESTETVEYPTVDDVLYEGDETVTVELSDPSGLTIVRATATATIIDNDPLPLLAFSRSSETYSEGATPGSICIDSDPAAEEEIDVTLRFSGSATPGTDYTGDDTLTLAAETTSNCHQVLITDDNVYEGDETVIVTIEESPGNYRVDAAAKTATITIRENDPVPSLTVTAFPGVEGGQNQGNTPVQGQEFGNVVFRFNLDGPAAVPISMNLETIDGAAVRGDDYRFNNPTLVFPAGQTEMFIKLPVIDDTEFDGTRNEDFELVASNPSVPVFTGRLRATGYIVDNETPPPGVDYVDDSIRTDAYIDVGESWVEGNAVIGGVEHRYDQDWYRTVLQANRCYQIEVRGKDAWEDFQEYPDDDPIQEYAPAQELTLSDPLIHGVYTDLGNYMPDTQEEYGGVGLGAVKLVTIDQTGTVYIAVSHAWYGDDDENEGGGTFDLSLIDLGRGSCTRMDPSVTDAWASITYRRHHTVSEGEGQDLPQDINTTGYVQPDGDPATGNIGTDNDIDWFKVPLVAGRSYRIDVKGDEESDYGGTLENPRLALYSSTGVTLNSLSEEIASYTGDRGHQIADNNSGRGNNARLEVEVNVTDTYFIGVQRSISSEIGTYTVVVTTIAN